MQFAVGAGGAGDLPAIGVALAAVHVLPGPGLAVAGGQGAEGVSAAGGPHVVARAAARGAVEQRAKPYLPAVPLDVHVVVGGGAGILDHAPGVGLHPRGLLVREGLRGHERLGEADPDGHVAARDAPRPAVDPPAAFLVAHRPGPGPPGVGVVPAPHGLGHPRVTGRVKSGPGGPEVSGGWGDASSGVRVARVYSPQRVPTPPRPQTTPDPDLRPAVAAEVAPAETPDATRVLTELLARPTAEGILEGALAHGASLLGGGVQGYAVLRRGEDHVSAVCGYPKTLVGTVLSGPWTGPRPRVLAGAAATSTNRTRQRSRPGSTRADCGTRPGRSSCRWGTGGATWARSSSTGRRRGRSRPPRRTRWGGGRRR